MRGVKYYNKGHVNDIEFYHDFFEVKVQGNDLYNVLIEFDNNTGKINYTECNCQAYHKYTGICKHIVAALLTILYKKEAFNKHAVQKSYDHIIENFSDALTKGMWKHQAKTMVNLEITFYPVDVTNRYVTSSYRLRVGEKRLYALKNFDEFYRQYKKGRLNFGKEFNYDSSYHYFNDIDDTFLNTLGDYFQMEAFIKQESSYSGFNSSNKNNLAIPEIYVKKTLSLLEDRSFHMSYHDIIFRDCHILTDINMVFDVTKTEHEICISIKDYLNFFPLTKDCQYVFYDDNIYKLDQEKQRLFQVIYKTFNNESKSIELGDRYKHKFVSSILPALKEMGTVSMDTEIKQKLYTEDLICEIYLDKYFNTVKGTVTFNYGDYKIGVIPVNEPNLPPDLILVQDIKKESNILSLLAEASCIQKEEHDFFTIDHEDALYDFIYYYLPKLQEMATIYYSENFKNIHIKEKHAIGGGIKLNETSNMLEFTFNIDGIDQSELSAIMKSLKEKKRYYKLKNGGFLPLDNEETENVGTLINQLNLSAKDFDKAIIEIPKYRALYMDSLLRDKHIKVFNRNQSFKKLVSDIKEPGDMHFTPPEDLANILRDYQKLGFKWLRTLAYYGFGGILADDMGLGKTLQSIALIQSTKSGNPSLVVAPTSLVYNWEDEINKFAPHMKVLVITGPRNDREALFDAIKSSDVIITSYGLLKRDIEDYDAYTFEYCFIDEAQHIKNPSSLNAKTVKLIRSKIRFALTGTPIENSLTELWSIFDFILPGYLLSHKKFIVQYERPIIKHQDEIALQQLNTQIRPFILRRLKQDVLTELPPKIETKMTTELTESQKKIYLGYMQQIKKDLAIEFKNKGVNRSAIKVLAALTRLRQICCHPSTFIDDYTGDSGKLQLLLELVTDAVESGHRILIFSGFTSMLSMIRDLLDQYTISNYYLDGSTSPENRRDMVHNFNSGDTSVFLISLKAGGTGLNLTGADMVIHYDPWWNPAVEDQATDRAYRIGQNKSVQVFKLITAGTIEERIYQLQQRKKSMIDAVIKPGETLLTKLGEEEIRALFDM